MSAAPVTRWGFLGAGFIATRALAPAVHAADGARLHAVASRDRSRAEGLEPVRVHATYQDLIDDDEVDAVYIALTNDQHRPWTLEALAAGKDVLCEKPLGLSASEVQTMVGAAADARRLLVEAAWYRWHPRTRRAEALLSQGAIGDVTEVEAAFTFGGVPPGDYRLDPARGGGAWYDVGCYTVNAATWSLPGAVIEAVDGHARFGLMGVDLGVHATVTTPSGAIVRLTAGIDDPPRQELWWVGTGGALAFDGADAFTSWHRPTRLYVRCDADLTTEEFEAVDPYRLMVESFGRRRAGDTGAWLPPADESLRTARTMDDVARSWRR